MPNKYSALLLTLLTALATPALAEEALKSYLVPDEVSCSLKGDKQLMFCTDTEGNPLTGIMVKYFENTLIRSYTVKDGYLDGLCSAYYTDGAKKTETPYTKGQINGTMRKYNRIGTLSEEIPYINGKKEGIAKYYNDAGSLITQMVYMEDNANGDMFIYDGLNETPLYRLKNLANELIFGTYTYQEPDETLKTVEIPEVIITAFNKKCLDFQPQFSTSRCAAIYNQNPECDQAWRKENRKAVRKYLKTCGAADE